MIFDQLVLHNFGQYRGRHVIELTPPSKDRPIILFGGMNGSGKTTLLDAFQLALFGKFARCSNRADLGYEEFLRRCVNRFVDPGEGAAVELLFRHVHEGKEHSYHVHRSWLGASRAVRETVEVVKDGLLDKVLTEDWTAQVEQFLPVRLSPFFFFDGEKIEALADIEKSAEALSTAVRALLGLDLVEQLATDLVVLERRKRNESRASPEQDVIATVQTEVDALEEARQRAVEQRASAQNHAAQAQSRFEAAESRFRAGGGEAFARVDETRKAHARATALLAKADDQLEEEAGGAAPLLLLSDLLSSVFTQDRIERDMADGEVLDQLLGVRDEKTLAAAAEAGAASETLAALRRFLTQDRGRYRPSRKTKRYLELTADARAHLTALTSQQSEMHARLHRAVAERDRLVADLEALERNLASVPDDDAVARLSEERDSALVILAAAEQVLADAQRGLEEAARAHQLRLGALQKLQDESASAIFKHDEAQRVVNTAVRVRAVLAEFGAAVSKRHMKRLESLILEGFQFLIRKPRLVTAVEIDDATYQLRLLGEDALELPPDRLSAGERQLLAVSIIWGLARASGRPTPVVVDTPLGRLDSEHRRRMVERYFPRAGSQVLVFSTDEEIDEDLYGKLARHVGRSYRIDHDASKRSACLTPGYFWLATGSPDDRARQTVASGKRSATETEAQHRIQELEHAMPMGILHFACRADDSDSHEDSGR